MSNFCKENLDMSQEELETFFNKYNIIELEEFNKIFENVKDYELEEVLTAARKVYKEKWEACLAEYEIPVRHYNFNVLDITKKNNLLSDKEIIFLNTLVENASLFVSSIQEYQEVYKNIIDDFSCDEYEIEKILKLEEELNKEVMNREKTKVKTKEFKMV